MNLQQLNYFCAIVQKQSYTRASEQLRVTQSTLSHSINELERELNAPLLIRNGRNITLTPFGEMLLQYVEPALSLLSEAQSKLKDMTDPESGMISVSYFSSLNDLVTYAISRYYEEAGKIQPHFRFFSASTTEIEEAISNGTSDLTFTTQIDNPMFGYHTIGYHETVIIVSNRHPLARYKEIHLSQLRNENIITYESRCQIRGYIDQLFRDAGFKPKVIFETTNDNIIFSSVSANFGIALIPKPLGEHASPVKVLRIKDEIPPRPIVLAWRKSRYLSRAADSFANYIIKNTALFDEYLKSTV